MQKRTTNHEELQNVARPVSALVKSYPANYEGYVHSHSRAQLLYAESGSIRLTMGLGQWIVPTGRAVWIPAGYPHQTGSIGPLEMRTLYFDLERVTLQAPEIPRMLQVSRLLHELILRFAAMPVEYAEQGQDALVVRTLLGEIDWTAVHPVSLPALQDKRLRRIQRTLLKNPAHGNTIESWAQQFDVSPRTLTRALKQETDLTFQQWTDQIRTYVAIPMLVDKVPLIEVAVVLGYSTAWAFTAMFKRVTGKLPSRYLEGQ